MDAFQVIAISAGEAPAFRPSASVMSRRNEPRTALCKAENGSCAPSLGSSTRAGLSGEDHSKYTFSLFLKTVFCNRAGCDMGCDMAPRRASLHAGALARNPAEGGQAFPGQLNLCDEIQYLEQGLCWRAAVARYVAVTGRGSRFLMGRIARLSKERDWLGRSGGGTAPVV